MSRIINNIRFIESRAGIKGRPQAGIGYHWLFALLTLVLTLGVYADGWSHIRFGTDQDLWNQYHITFLSAIAALILLFLVATAYYYREGYSLWHSIPAGYEVNLMGLIVFALTSPLDLLGHYLFGFEVGMEGLVSPTHMSLFVAWILIVNAPLRIGIRRYGQEGWWKQLPALISFVLTLAAISFAIFPFLTFGSEHFGLVENRTSNIFFGEIIGLVNIYLQTMLLVGSLVWLVVQMRLPTGALSLILLGYTAIMATLHGSWWMLPVGLIAGILLDLLYLWLQPEKLSEKGKLYLFGCAVPVFLWLPYYAVIHWWGIGGGLWYTQYIWSGSILYGIAFAAGIVFLLTTQGSLADE